MLECAEDVQWRTGFEIELLAPRGASRRDLAEALAGLVGGRVQQIFYPQSELSQVPGLQAFENLTLGFDAPDDEGELVARCVDDVTILEDLDRQAPPLPDWYRIVSDDARLLRLVMAQCDPDLPLRETLLPVARLFGTDLGYDDDMVRLTDAMGASVAIGATMPSERERPCELITPPMDADHHAVLSVLLGVARDLGFSVPVEAAVHIHFDATRLRSARTVARLVTLLDREGDRLKRIVATNPNCRRLGAFPKELLDAVAAPGFQDLDWTTAQAKLADLDVTKYCDFNLLNLIHDMPGKPTFEVRIFPGSMDADQIVRWARLFSAILEWAIDGADEVPESDAFYRGLALSAADLDWALAAD